MVLLGGSWSAALAPSSPAPVAALPGAYVTLPFELVGEGAYGYRVEVPEPWAPLAATGRVQVAGSGFVSVTVRVPTAVASGTVAPVVVTFRSEADADDVVVATGRIEVLARAAIDLVLPDDLEGRIGERSTFPVYVRNSGNEVDRVRISATSTVFDVRFEPSVLDLRPGEQAEVAASLEVRGTVSSGYRSTLRVAAASANDAEVVARARTAVVFVDADAEAASRAPDAPPSLEFRVQSGVRGGVALDADGTTGFLEYELRPGLGGALSDLVDVQAGTGPLAGSIADPFERLPSSLDVALTGADWDASARLGSGGYALAGGRVVGDWRVGGTTSATPTGDALAFGVDAFAASLDPDLGLQFSGRVAGAGADRQDGLGARYRLVVADGLSLGVGADLLGSATERGYEVVPVLHQSLTWQTQGFDVTQSYATVPLAGLHTFGVSGGARVLAPIGVRASTSVQLAPDATRSRTTLTLTARPAPRFSVALAGSFATNG
ncbi:MAG: hypothetical protein P1P87_10700, partial [Trueperaceae bacterium]|nr:hypothetical protein [Trueperaceae bacterium]